MFKRYKIPDAVGYLGWFEDIYGEVIAWVGLDKKCLFVWEI